MPRNSNKLVKKVKKGGAYQFTSWCFTLNNYTEDEMLWLTDAIQPSNDRIIAAIAWSEEVGGKKAVPHLQGFLQTYKKGI